MSWSNPDRAFELSNSLAHSTSASTTTRKMCTTFLEGKSIVDCSSGVLQGSPIS